MTHKLKFDIITLFPSMFTGPLSESIILRAQKNDLIEINLHQLRDCATDKHKTVDDTPYGGGPGMVLRVDIIDRAIQSVILSPPFGGRRISRPRHTALNTGSTDRSFACTQDDTKRRVILLSPTGQKFTQQKAIEFAKYDNIILICGHYEGFDQRIHEHLIDEEISIGDYVLTGGELPAMVMIDAISRMIPGVLKEESILNESFMNQDTRNKMQDTNKYQIQKSNLTMKPLDCTRDRQFDNEAMNYFDYPVYTKPAEYKGWKVPSILQSGNHAEIEKWREVQKKQKRISERQRCA